MPEIRTSDDDNEREGVVESDQPAEHEQHEQHEQNPAAADDLHEENEYIGWREQRLDEDAASAADAPDGPSVAGAPIAAAPIAAAPSATDREADRDADPGRDDAYYREESRTSAAVRAERERLAAERTARREARLSAMSPTADATPTQVQRVVVTKRQTDGFMGALSMFLLRLVVAAIMGIHGVSKLLDIPQATEVFTNTVLPYPRWFAIGVGAAEVAIAIALVFGVLTRLAGLGVTLIGAGALALVYWGPWSPFVPGKPGFTGELELLLTVVGIVLLAIGAGRWSVDSAFRRRREEDRAAREAGL